MYLNRNDREHYLFTAALLGELNRWLDESTPFEKEELKFLRMARSLLRRSLIRLMDSVDVDQKDRILKQAKNYYVTILPSKNRNPDEEMTVSKDALFDLASYPLYFVCKQHDSEKGCMHSDKTYKKCELYQNMVQLDIPLANDGRGRGCPYRFR